MQIIIISGEAKSGKDFFIEKVQEKELFVTNISTIDPIKKCFEVLGVDIDKNNTEHRQLLHKTKMWWVENFNGAFNYIVSTVQKIREDGDTNILFIHSREVKEIEMFKILFNAKTMLVKAKNTKSNECQELKEQIYEYDYDIVIENDFDDITVIETEVENFIDNYRK